MHTWFVSNPWVCIVSMVVSWFLRGRCWTSGWLSCRWVCLPYLYSTAIEICSASYYKSTLCGFVRGEVDGETFSRLVRKAYEVVVHWWRNIFLVPSGISGNHFDIELSKLYQAFGDNSSLHSIAFTACSVMQVLLLQKPHAKSKSKEHSICLEHRLVLWGCGDIASLLRWR